MSKLDTLIAELCPDGVEYKQLWQVTTWDKRFNGVDRTKQPAINPHHYYLAKELRPVLAGQGDIKVLTTSPSSLYTAEDLVDESRIKDGEIIAIPGGAAMRLCSTTGEGTSLPTTESPSWIPNQS